MDGHEHSHLGDLQEFWEEFEVSKEFNAFPRDIQVKLISFFRRFFREKSEVSLSDPVSSFYAESLNREENSGIFIPMQGTVYTPEYIVKLMLMLVQGDQVRTVLDPASGTGTFGVPLLAEKTLFPNLKRFDCVEIDAFAYNIGLVNLLGTQKGKRSLKEKIIFSHNLDFLRGYDSSHIYDLIIGNPPYIRQELLERKDELLKRCPHASSKADMSIFFIDRATSLLAPGGRLCFIVPDKWVDVQYGVPLKAYLLENFLLEYLIWVEKKVFREDVDAFILILQKPVRKTQLQRMETKFVRLKESCLSNSEWLYSQIMQTNERSSRGIPVEISTIPQCQIDPEDKWSSLAILGTPPGSYFAFLGATVPLHNNIFSRVEYGNKTGVTTYFLPSLAVIEQYNLDQFLKPAIKSSRTVNEYILTSHEDWILSIPPELDINQYQGLKEYIDDGESKKFHKRPSCRTRTPWYSLTLKPPPDFVFPRFIHENPIVAWNKVSAFLNDSLQCIYVSDKYYFEFLFIYLNSSLAQLFYELMGREEGAGALQLMIYETRRIPVPDPRSISEDRLKIYRRVFQNYRATPMQEPRDEFDRLIFADFVPAIISDQLLEVKETMRNRRLLKRKSSSQKSRKVFA